MEKQMNEYYLPNGWTCVACGEEYLQDTKGQQVADYSEGTMCNKCVKGSGYEVKTTTNK